MGQPVTQGSAGHAALAHVTPRPGACSAAGRHSRVPVWKRRAESLGYRALTSPQTNLPFFRSGCTCLWLTASFLDAKYTPRDPTYRVPPVRGTAGRTVGLGGMRACVRACMSPYKGFVYRLCAWPPHPNVTDCCGSCR
eukprot:362997-Chlamydomonas_euryale.AAC.4